VMDRLREIYLVAGFDLMESLRSRKALVLLALYVAGSVGASFIFLEALSSVEDVAAEQLRVATTTQPGAMTDTLMQSEQFLDMVANLVDDRELAESLVSVPAMALFYGWMSLTFAPILVTLTSSDAISSELGSGSVRFALFRTDRLSWATGKLAGQTALLGLGVFGGALAAFLVGWSQMAGFDASATGWWLARISLRSWVFGFAWLGLTMGISQLTRSTARARAGALLALFAAAVTNAWLGGSWMKEHAPVVGDTLAQLLPQAYRIDLWRPEVVDRAPAMIMCLALGALYFAAGHAVFSRRDS